MSNFFEILKRAQDSIVREALATAQSDQEHQARVFTCNANRTTPSAVGISSTPGAPANTSPSGTERRKQKRASISLAVRLRPADPNDEGVEEILRTVNSCRTNLYCTTASDHYYPGMSLRITFPFHSAHDSLTASEDTGELSRLERLPDHRFGLAILLRGPANAGAHALTRSYASGKLGRERRLAVRHSFTAAAVVISPQGQMHVQARCADLSTNGCYVDTMNPYPEGTRVHLQLKRKEQLFETAASVRSSHVGMGMGLAFHERAPEQKSLLSDWLSGESSTYYAAN
jgi:PilZ domain